MRFEYAAGQSGKASYAYDHETGILAVSIGEDAGGECGAIELADYGGGIIILHTRSSVIGGVEIVVWPEIDGGCDLEIPDVTETGVVVPPLEVDEIECDLVARVNEDGSLLHLAVNDGYAEHTVRIADKLIVDLDDDQELSGLWLLDVPHGVSVPV